MLLVSIQRQTSGTFVTAMGMAPARLRDLTASASSSAKVPSLLLIPQVWLRPATENASLTVNGTPSRGKSLAKSDSPYGVVSEDSRVFTSDASLKAASNL